MLLDAMTNAEIAAAMGLKEQVVKNYLVKLYDKVGCSSRTEFVAMVLLGGKGKDKANGIPHQHGNE